MSALRCIAAVALLLTFSGAQGGRVALHRAARRRALTAFGLPDAQHPIPVNVSDSKDIFGPNGLVSKLNITGFLSGFDGFNLTELDSATLGGAKHYTEEHNSDISLDKEEFAFGGGKNAESNDTASELGYGGGGTFDKSGNFSVGGGGGATIKDLNVGFGGGASKGTTKGNSSSAAYSPYVPPHAP